MGPIVDRVWHIDKTQDFLASIPSLCRRLNMRLGLDISCGLDALAGKNLPTLVYCSRDSYDTADYINVKDAQLKYERMAVQQNQHIQLQRLRVISYCWISAPTIGFIMYWCLIFAVLNRSIILSLVVVLNYEIVTLTLILLVLSQQFPTTFFHRLLRSHLLEVFDWYNVDHWFLANGG